jgi:hypothetical protein
MSYYALLVDSSNNQHYYDDKINLYSTTRSGISTSDNFYYKTFGFSANQMKISIDEFGSLIANNFSYINFDLNAQSFFGICSNISRPTIVEITQISGYETGYGVTNYVTNYSVGQKMIQNYSNPTNIYTINSTNLTTSTFSNSLTYIQNGVFGYVNYNDPTTKISKYFLAAPGGQWYELPDQKFYYNVDFYITIPPNYNFINKIPIAQFNGIVPMAGQTILINNISNNDTLSGLYVIGKISDVVYVSPSSIKYNYPSQTFVASCNLDNSNINYFNSVCYYVPYDYGAPTKCFNKNLQLKLFTSSSYMPLYNDPYSFSSFILCLTPTGLLTQQSDTFQIGINVSNWFPDSLLFGVSLNYEIKEGNL